jgi:hypothetical protein
MGRTDWMISAAERISDMNLDGELASVCFPFPLASAGGFLRDVRQRPSLTECPRPEPSA